MRFIWSVIKFIGILLIATLIWMGAIFGESDTAVWIIIIASSVIPIYFIIKLFRKMF